MIVALEHSIEWQEVQAAAFEAQYERVEAHDFGGIDVILYEGR